MQLFKHTKEILKNINPIQVSVEILTGNTSKKNRRRLSPIKYEDKYFFDTSSDEWNGDYVREIARCDG